MKQWKMREDSCVEEVDGKWWIDPCCSGISEINFGPYGDPVHVIGPFDTEKEATDHLRMLDTIE